MTSELNDMTPTLAFEPDATTQGLLQSKEAQAFMSQLPDYLLMKLGSVIQHLITTNQLKIVMSNNINARGPRPGSFNAQVQELNPGESVSKVRMVDVTMTVDRLPDEMPALRQQVRNSVAPAVARAKEIVGGDYTVEVGDVVMPSGKLYVVAVVTRTA